MDRDQSAAEHYSIAVWLVITATCYFAAVVPLGAAIPLAIVALQLLICIVGLTPLQNNVNVNSALVMVVMVVASSYFGVAPSPVRYAAWFFFAILILNVVAWMILMLMRDSVREMEQQCGT